MKRGLLDLSKDSTSNSERRIKMTRRFIYLKPSAPNLAMGPVKSNFKGWLHFARPCIK
jgi:hypothetical protein